MIKSFRAIIFGHSGWIILFILIDFKHLENDFIELLTRSQGFQKGIICRGFNDKILWNLNFLTFWIILFIVIDLKYFENNFIEVPQLQGFQKGIICRGFNDKTKNQQKHLGLLPMSIILCDIIDCR